MIKIKTVRGVCLDAFPKVKEISFITDPNKGLTIGFFRLERMVFVSVAWCAPEDEFSRAKGRDIVATRIVESQGVFLPLGSFDNNRIAQTLLAMFNHTSMDY